MLTEEDSLDSVFTCAIRSVLPFCVMAPFHLSVGTVTCECSPESCRAFVSSPPSSPPPLLLFSSALKQN